MGKAELDSIGFLIVISGYRKRQGFRSALARKIK
jgi:hypothetical protein